MRYKIDGHEYDGTPQEISDLLWLVRVNEDARIASTDTKEELAREGFNSFKQADFAPLEDVVGESEALRLKLAKDPNYNPFGGVVASHESDPNQQGSPTVSAEDNTGVEII